MSPPSPQPKQRHVSRSGLTMNDGCLLRVERAESLVGGAGALELDRLADDLEHAELRLDLGGDARRAHPEARIPFDGVVVKWFVNSAEQLYRLVKPRTSRGRRGPLDERRYTWWSFVQALPDVPYRMTSTSSPTDAATLRSAFRDVHAARLHGFALLVTCGDGEAAAHLTNAVLGAHASRIAVEAPRSAPRRHSVRSSCGAPAACGDPKSPMQTGQRRSAP